MSGIMRCSYGCCPTFLDWIALRAKPGNDETITRRYRMYKPCHQLAWEVGQHWTRWPIASRSQGFWSWSVYVSSCSSTYILTRSERVYAVRRIPGSSRRVVYHETSISSRVAISQRKLAHYCILIGVIRSSRARKSTVNTTSWLIAIGP